MNSSDILKTGDSTIGTAPPERLEDRVQQCEAIDEHGRRCRILTLHPRCWKHRRQSWRANDFDGPEAA